MSSVSRERARPRNRVGPDPYVAFLAHVEREKSATTADTYGRIIRQLQAIHPTPDGITPEDIRRFLARPVGDRFHASGPRATNTRRMEHGCLRAFWCFLGETYALTNVMNDVPIPPKPRRLRPKSVSRAQVGALLEVLPTEAQRALVLLMADAGLRVSEACAITPERCVLEGRRRHLRVLGKGSVERLVPIGGRLAAALAVQVEHGQRKGWRPSEPLVRTKTGRPWTRGQVWDVVAAAGLRAGIEDMHPHRLRHGWACWLHYERKAALGVVSRLLGHASLSVTQEYLGVRDEELFNALSWMEGE